MIMSKQICIYGPTIKRVPVAISGSDCIYAKKMFCIALEINKVTECLYYLSLKYNSVRTPRNISVRILNGENDTVAQLKIDFFRNRLVTYFQGRENSLKLSCALGIIA